MKKILMILTICAASSQALADGFRCESTDGSLNITVYNNTDADLGTRNAAVMVLSDPRVQQGRKTIATFHASTGLLNSEALVFTSKVDLRYRTSNRKGEYIAGTRLGYVDRIRLIPGFTYSSPVRNGSALAGVLEVEKRNGDMITMDLDCVRYLKN